MDDWMVNVEGHVEKIALQVAERMLPREMSRLRADRLDQLRQALAAHARKNQLSEPDAAEIEAYPTDELWRPLARACVDALTHPAADVIPRIPSHRPHRLHLCILPADLLPPVHCAADNS